VITPPLPARMKQGDQLTRQRIGCIDAHVFAVVAALARESEIVWFACTSSRQWRDMLDGKRIG